MFWVYDPKLIIDLDRYALINIEIMSKGDYNRK